MAWAGATIRLGRVFAGCRAASTAIEFALLAPVFLLFLFGIIAYGVYFGAAHSIEQISADAARVALAGLTESERQALVSSFVSRNAGGYIFVNAADIVVTARNSLQDGTQFVVSISYDAKDLPIFNLLSGLPLPETTISRHSTIRIGGI
jgi:Flp pilus assembly protein TadG